VRLVLDPTHRSMAMQRITIAVRQQPTPTRARDTSTRVPVRGGVAVSCASRPGAVMCGATGQEGRRCTLHGAVPVKRCWRAARRGATCCRGVLRGVVWGSAVWRGVRRITARHTATVSTALGAKQGAAGSAGSGALAPVRRLLRGHHARCGATWCGVARRGTVRRGAARCGAVWRGAEGEVRREAERRG
jgi:hypothetical protein